MTPERLAAISETPWEGGNTALWCLPWPSAAPPYFPGALEQSSSGCVSRFGGPDQVGSEARDEEGQRNSRKGKENS